jgi:hypothetical protein
MNIPSPLASYVSSVITSPSEPYKQSDASSAANVTSDDFISDDISLQVHLVVDIKVLFSYSALLPKVSLVFRLLFLLCTVTFVFIKLHLVTYFVH